MASQLPVSRVVSASVNLTPAGAQAQSLSDLLVMGTSTVIDNVERYRFYSSLAAVAADFGTACEEYYSARAWFAQVPQPLQIVIGRWVNAASAGGLRCGPLSAAEQLLSAWTGITAGKFDVTIDGVLTHATGLNFSAATTLNGIAALITTALAAAATCTWNSVYSRFEFVSATTGAASAVSFLSAPGSGVDISAQLKGRSTSTGAYTYAGQVAETAVAAVAILDNLLGQRWYGVTVPSADNAGAVLVGAYIEAATNKHVFGANTTEAGVLVSSSTTDLAYLMKAAGYRRSIVQYSSSSGYAICSLLGRILPTNYDGSSTVITLKFKNEPGTTAENLSTTQADNAEAKNANVFVAYDNLTNIVEQGVMCDGTFADIVMGTDWLALDIQRRVYDVLYGSATKIPQTNAGVQLLQTAIEASCAQAVVNGLLAPGIWNSDGFGQLQPGDYLQKGYYVYAQPIDEQSEGTRALRIAPPFKVAAKLAGAIHFADVQILVNQ